MVLRMSKSSQRTKPEDPEQSKRFLETAEEVGADADDAALERAFKKIAKERESPKTIRRP
jgi:hypothetical protein